jgi:HSP20 family protein
MTTTVIKSSHEKHPAILKLMDNDPFFRHMNEVYGAIARRAFELFEGRGRQHGHDLEDWFRAEFESLSPMRMEISEADNELIVRADLPGFRDTDVEVRVAPRRLVISGKREEVHDGRKRKTIYSERRSDEVFRTLDLPEEIDPNKAKATLHEGTLEIDLPKAHLVRRLPVTARAA